MYCLPVWLLDVSGVIQAYVWAEPKAVTFMFIVYHLELFTDILTTWKSGQLTPFIAYRKVQKVLFSCIAAALLLGVSSNAAKYSPWFNWLPDAIFFLILSGLILIILKRFSSMGYINPVVAQVLTVRLNNLIESQKTNNETGNPTGSGLSA